MKIMKFGGTSVGSAANIKKVAAILKAAAAKDRCVVVVSAMHGITDRLIEAGRTAEKGSDGFYGSIEEIKQRHVDALGELFPDSVPRVLLEFLDSASKELTETCEGVRLVREL